MTHNHEDLHELIEWISLKEKTIEKSRDEAHNESDINFYSGKLEAFKRTKKKIYSMIRK